MATITRANVFMSQGERQRVRRRRPESVLCVGRNVRFRLESRIGYVDMVHEMAEGFARRVGFTKPMTLNIGLAVREAVINAIKHGNGMDASKSIDVGFEQDDGLFRIRVRDQGPGFDWTRTANPLDGENILRTSGRGILFMRHFFDKVEFRRRRGKGTEVVLEKKIKPAGRAGRNGREVIKRRKG